MKRYSIHEIFTSIQGEGFHAGRRAIFVRFSGCNAWSGLETDRVRDTARACCAAWCDTAFVGTSGSLGGRYTAAELAGVIDGQGHDSGTIVVLTGGEPALQLDEQLFTAIRTRVSMWTPIHVETNGTRKIAGDYYAGPTWITLSPKPPLAVEENRYDEVKVIYPAVDPLPWTYRARERFVQPQDGDPSAVGKCVDFVLRNPLWRMSLQTHKILGLQ